LTTLGTVAVGRASGNAHTSRLDCSKFSPTASKGIKAFGIFIPVLTKIDQLAAPPTANQAAKLKIQSNAESPDRGDRRYRRDLLLGGQRHEAALQKRSREPRFQLDRDRSADRPRGAREPPHTPPGATDTLWHQRNPLTRTESSCDAECAGLERERPCSPE